MTLSFEDALKRLKSGEALGSVLMAARPQEEISVRRGTALVRQFDRETFDVISGGRTPFDEFVRQSAIEQVPGVDGTFRMKEPDRRQLLSGWAGTSEWRALNTTLANYFSRRAPDGSIDQLIHLLALGTARDADAAQLFTQLFDDADARLDLASCSELLDTVAAHEEFLSPVFRHARDVSRCRLNARQLWSDEYFRTTPYHEREGMAAVLETLVATSAKPILQVFGGGGVGKTMFVRWALARHCVPHDIPCARLDFDFESPVLVERSPWRLLLKVAQQLNAQIPGQPFSELVKEYQDVESEEEQIAVAAAGGFYRANNSASRYNDEAFSRFHSSLADVPLSRPPIVILDTLERVTLYQDHAVVDLVRQFIGSGTEPRVRLMLAGRYNLEDAAHLPGFAAAYSARTSTFPLQPFSAVEARVYLTSRRGLANSDQVDAIIERSNGIPFKLSLFATIVQDDPSLDGTVIREMPNVNVEYLIKRVVDHMVGEPLAQWVLRHGVVPRQLTKAFLSDVMLPRLRQIQKNEGQLDSGQDKLPERLRKADRFKHGLAVPANEAGVDVLWATLNRYAADYSWVSQSRDWPDTLVFHRDVVDAMRGLLQDHEIFLTLHDDAIAYYEQKAKTDWSNRVRWLREALYHRFQRGGPEAIAAWKRDLSEGEWRRDLEMVRGIAAELLGSEYVDDAGVPRTRFDGTPMVPATAIVQANFEAARAGITEARLQHLPATNALWVTSARQLADAERLQRNLPRAVLDPTRVAIAKASIELLQRPEKALEILEKARARLRPELAAEFEELCGDAIVDRDTSAAAGHYQAAVKALGKAIRDAQGRAILLKAADTAAKSGDYLTASASAQTALTAAEAAKDGTSAGTARIRLAATLLNAGKITSTLTVTSERARNKLLGFSDDDNALLDALDARARIRAGDPLDAWRQAHRRFPRAFGRDTDDAPTVRDAFGLELKGILCSEFYEFEEALSAWRAGSRAWDLLHRAADSLDCVFRAVRMLIRNAWQPELAAQMMSEAERTAASLGPAMALKFKILEAERVSLGRPEDRHTIREILHTPNLAKAYEPSVAIAASIQALTLGDFESRAAQLLASTLGRVTPPLARFAALGPRSRPITISRSTQRALVQVLKAALDEAQKGNVARGIALDALEVMRMLGDNRRAEAWLERLAKSLTKDTIYSLLPMREVAIRLKSSPKLAIFDRSLTKLFLDQFRAHPRTRGVLLLLEAEVNALHDGRAPKPYMLERIDRMLGDRSTRAASLQERFERLTRPIDAASAPDEVDVAVKPAKKAVTPLSMPEARSTLTFAFGRDDKTMQVAGADGRTSGRQISSRFPKLAGGSLRTLTAQGLVFPTALSERMASDETWPVEITQLLCDETTLTSQTGPVDSRIETSHSMFGAIPWELGQLQGKPLTNHPKVACLYRSAPASVAMQALTTFAQRALQRALKTSVAIDGILGPQTASLLTQFQHANGLPATGTLQASTITALGGARGEGDTSSPVVVVLRRSVQAQRRQTRGVAATGVDIASNYRAAGWDVLELLDPTTAALRAAMRDHLVRVLHVNVGIDESSRRGALVLDVGREVAYKSNVKSVSSASAVRTRGLGITELADFLRFVDPARAGDLPRADIVAAPVVVIDPPFVPSRIEASRQLLKRNAFASDLFQLGVVPAIVGIGLMPPAAEARVAGNLVAGFTRGDTLANIAATMRLGDGPDSTGGRPEIALFAHYADYSPWPSFTGPRK